jgi:predicted small secreted protein
LQQGEKMKKLELWALMMFVLMMTGCNTMQGFGKDVKKAGAAVENAAKK